MEKLLTPELFGVIIGGVIGLAGSLVVAIIERAKWKHDRKLENLRNRRQQLETLFREAVGKLRAGMSSGAYEIDLITSMVALTPTAVSKAFDDMMMDNDRSVDSLRGHALKISSAMKTELAIIDKEIEELYK